MASRTIYNGRDPREVAEYGVSDAARFVDVPPATLRSDLVVPLGALLRRLTSEHHAIRSKAYDALQALIRRSTGHAAPAAQCSSDRRTRSS